jgi:hypothetical protein
MRGQDENQNRRLFMRYVAELDPPNQPPDPAAICLRAVTEHYQLRPELSEVEIPAAAIEKLELAKEIGEPDDESPSMTIFPDDHGFKTLAKHFGG